MSERQTCKLVELSRSVKRYDKRPDHNNELRQALTVLTQPHQRVGYRQLYDRLGRQGWIVNHKRIERLYAQGGLALIGAALGAAPITFMFLFQKYHLLRFLKISCNQSVEVDTTGYSTTIPAHAMITCFHGSIDKRGHSLAHDVVDMQLDMP